MAFECKWLLLLSQTWIYREQQEEVNFHRRNEWITPASIINPLKSVVTVCVWPAGPHCSWLLRPRGAENFLHRSPSMSACMGKPLRWKHILPITSPSGLRSPGLQCFPWLTATQTARGVRPQPLAGILHGHNQTLQLIPHIRPSIHVCVRACWASVWLLHMHVCAEECVKTNLSPARLP